MLLRGVLWDIEQLGALSVMLHEEFPVTVPDAEGWRHVAVIGPLDAGNPFPVKRTSPRGWGGAEPVGRLVFAVRSEVRGHFYAGESRDGGEEVDASCDSVLFDAASRNLAGPANESEGADAAFVHAAFAGAKRAGAADPGVGSVTDTVVFRTVVAGEEDERVVGQTECVEGVQQATDLGVQVGERGAEDLHLRAKVLGVGVILAGPFAEGGIIRLGLEFRVDRELFRRRLQRGVRDERPQVDVEGLVLVGLGELDRLIDHQRRGTGAEVGLLAFIAKRGAGGIDRLGNIEPIGLGGGRTLASTEVPFTEVGRRVAGLLQEIRKGGHVGIEPIGHRAGGVLLVGSKVAVDEVTRRVVRRHEGRTTG